MTKIWIKFKSNILLNVMENRSVMAERDRSLYVRALHATDNEA